MYLSGLDYAIIITYFIIVLGAGLWISKLARNNLNQFKWDKLRYKLETAAQAGVSEAITFEFSHFMSPQSAYPQAGHLYHRYLEYLNEKK